jgi:fatty acid desaturase
MRHDNRDQPVTIAMTRKQRIGFAFLGVLILCFGVGNLAAGRLHYSNWWGGAVFAPFAVVIGTMAIMIALVVRRK